MNNRDAMKMLGSCFHCLINNKDGNPKELFSWTCKITKVGNCFLFCLTNYEGWQLLLSARPKEWLAIASFKRGYTKECVDELQIIHNIVTSMQIDYV